VGVNKSMGKNSKNRDNNLDIGIVSRGPSVAKYLENFPLQDYDVLVGARDMPTIIPCEVWAIVDFREVSRLYESLKKVPSLIWTTRNCWGKFILHGDENVLRKIVMDGCDVHFCDLELFDYPELEQDRKMWWNWSGTAAASYPLFVETFLNIKIDLYGFDNQGNSDYNEEVVERRNQNRWSEEKSVMNAILHTIRGRKNATVRVQD